MSRRPGGLAIVLHTHMPYVEGFGTWPFGEEWLWEAIACSYLPLLDVLDAAPGRVTLSVTPVLGDQLEAPGALEPLPRVPARDPARLARARPAGGDAGGGGRARVLRGGVRPGGRRAGARRPRGADGRATRRGPRRPRTPSCRCWPRTRACGCSSRRASPRTAARSGAWDGGFWLPECAHAPWLDPLLEEAGVRADVRGPHGRRARRPGPLRPPAGPLLVPLDRPGARARLEPRRLPVARRLPRHAPAHGAPPPGLGRRRRGLRPGAGGGAGARPTRPTSSRACSRSTRFCCVAWDTELLGLHWHEGVLFLAAVLEAAEAAGLRIAPLDELVAEADGGARARSTRATSWGAPRTLDTWSAPAGRRPRLAPAPRGAARAAGRRARARCASCSRSSPPTGRS